MPDRRDDEAVIAELQKWLRQGRQLVSTSAERERIDGFTAALASLSLRLQNAETALRRFGSHRLECPYQGTKLTPDPLVPCSCGFSAALASSAEREPENETA